MVEWRVVHTKFQDAKIKIERMVDNDVKFVLPFGYNLRGCHHIFGII
jgi:hypothetical protein